MNIYVGNLSSSVKEEDLRNLFSPFGNITSIKIIKDMYTGVSKGFSFIELSGKPEDAIRQLNNKDLKGKNMVVSEARSKNTGHAGTGRDNRRPYKSFNDSRSGRW